MSVAVEAVSCTTPANAAGSPIIWRSQSITTSSTSVAAGDVCQLMPCAPSPAAARSPSTEARLVFEGKYAKKPGWFQCVMPGTTASSSAAIASASRPPSAGGSSGKRARMAPGATGLITGQRGEALAVVRDPVDERVAETAELFGVHGGRV